LSPRDTWRAGRRPLREHVDVFLSAERAEELAYFSEQQVRLLHRGEVAAARHLRPALDVQARLGPAARAARQLFGEHRNADGRMLDLGPAAAVLAARLVVHVRGAGG